MEMDILYSVYYFTILSMQVQLKTLESHGDKEIYKKAVKLRKLTDACGFSAMVILFFSCLFFILAVLSCKCVCVCVCVCFCVVFRRGFLPSSLPPL